jgi:hypothetical protein
MRHFAAIALGLSLGAWTAFGQTPGTTPPGTTPPGRTPPGTTPAGTTPPGRTPPGTTPPGTTPPAKPPASRQPVERQPVERQPLERQPVERQPVERQPVERQPEWRQNPTGQNPGVQNPGIGGAGQNPGVTGQVPNRQSPTGSFYPFGLPHHGPLFQYQDVRKDLNINDQQLNEMNRSFEVLNSEFATEFGKLKEEERARRANALRSRYWEKWNSGVNRVLEPEQLKRYRQLDLQYRGWGALMDPELQTQLNLSAEQKQRLDQLYGESLQTYSDIHRMGQTNRDAALQRYIQWREQTRRGINEFLTEEQRRNWAEMTGDAYRFAPNFGRTDNRPPTNATVPREPMPDR